MGCAVGWVHCRAAEDELGLSDGSVDADDDWLAEVLLSHVASMPLPLPFPLPALVRAAAVALTLPSHSLRPLMPVYFVRAWQLCRSGERTRVTSDDAGILSTARFGGRASVACVQGVRCAENPTSRCAQAADAQTDDARALVLNTPT
jgi:hypothetical protein